MTSAAPLIYLGFATVLAGACMIAVSEGTAQTNIAAQAQAGSNDERSVNRGTMRLELLQSLVKNELRAASIRKNRLASEQVELTRERAELSAIGDKRRPADNVRLEQIGDRLGTIDQELETINAKLPEIAAELNNLQLRLDEANGIVRSKKNGTAETAALQVGDDGTSEEPSASRWLDGKRRIQEALVYLGGYNALIDGDFGPRTTQAIKVYQERQDLEQTGVLTDEQEAALLTEAQAQRALYGVTSHRDDNFGYSLSYPTLLLSQTERISAGEQRMTTTDGRSELLISVIENSDDLDALYDEAATIFEIQYQRRKDGWFVVAGLADEDRVVYDTVKRSKENLIRARLSYPLDQSDLWSPFAVIMFNTFEILPAS